MYCQIENSNDEVADNAFKNALLPENDLRRALVRNPVHSMTALMAQVNRYVEQEEDDLRAKESFGLPVPKSKEQFRPAEGLSRQDRRHSGKPPRGNERRHSRNNAPDEYRPRFTPATASAPSSSAPRRYQDVVCTIFNEPLRKIFDDIKEKPYFRWPEPMTGDPSYRNPNKYCDYHKQSGHKVEFCQSFKAHLERLVKDGHLKQYLQREENVNSARTTERREERPQARRDDQP